MSDDIRSLLGPHGYRVLGVSEEGRDAIVHVEPPAEASGTRCGVITARVHARAPRPSRLPWAFVDGRRIWASVRRRHLWCAECGRAFTARLPGVAARARMSLTAQAAILAALRELSFAALARSHGVSNGRARRALERLPVPWCDRSLLVGEDGPVSLGVDEQHWCKERLRDLYRAFDRRTAAARWTNLLTVMEASDDAAVLICARTLRAWRREIMGYFELPITNGFTVGCHTKIKLLKRLKLRSPQRPSLPAQDAPGVPADRSGGAPTTLIAIEPSTGCGLCCSLARWWNRARRVRLGSRWNSPGFSPPAS